MSREALLLSQLEDHEGYKILKELWRLQITDIEQKRDSAAKRGSETAWRYWAGVEKGYKMAVVQLNASLSEMEQEDDAERAADRFKSIVQDLKGEIPA